MARRVRVARVYEKAELAVRAVALAVELASLGLLSYVSFTFWYDHATNPIAYVGVTIALMTDVAELFTLSTINCGVQAQADGREQQQLQHEHNGWPQARLAWVALGDMASAVLLFFSWIWLITRGMFWSCVVDAAALESPGSVMATLSRRVVGKDTGSLGDDDGAPAVYANCDGVEYPSDTLQKLSWILPFVMA